MVESLHTVPRGVSGPLDTDDSPPSSDFTRGVVRDFSTGVNTSPSRDEDKDGGFVSVKGVTVDRPNTKLSLVCPTRFGGVFLSKDPCPEKTV